MPAEKNKILKFNQYMKSDKISYIIYADLECLIKKIDGCENNPENTLATKVGEHIPWGFWMSTIWGFDHLENKYTLYRGRDCMKILCDSLKEHANNITSFEKKKMLPLTKKELTSHEDAKECYICEKEIQTKDKDIGYRKVEIIVIIQGNTEVQRIVSGI